MIKLSKHFTRHEFSCKCGCGFDTVDSELLVMLEAIREHFGKPVVISSACRCPAHNEAVGGAPNSQHKLGRAADIVVGGIDPVDVATFVEQAFTSGGDRGGVGWYDNFTHIDSRNQRVSWFN